jgi:hypothetical protein
LKIDWIFGRSVIQVEQKDGELNISFPEELEGVVLMMSKK